MRNSYYDFNGWGRDSGVVPQKWEPGKPIPFDQEPEKTGAAQQEADGPRRTPDVRKKRIKKPRNQERNGAGGFLFFLALLLSLMGLGVYFQGGALPQFPPRGGIWDILSGEGDWYRYYEYYEYEEDNWREELKDTTAPRAPTGTGVTLPLDMTEGAALTAQEIYQQVSPAVVGVRVGLENGGALGTGIVMSADGYILTNAHVIAGSRSLQVVLPDNSRKEALLVGYDGASDLAVLKVEAQGLTVACFGSSDQLQVGDPAYAIGNHLGEELWATMTDGIISATERTVAVDGGDMVLLQTTAAINSGSSGGALVDQFGRVVGITNMKMMSDWETIEGLAFAVPSTTAKDVVDQLIAQGHYSGRPMLGITVFNEEGHGDVPAGIYVSSVERKSDAYQKGIREGDVITGANGRRIFSLEDLSEVKSGLQAGQSITLEVWSDGERRTVSVELVEGYVLEN